MCMANVRFTRDEIILALDVLHTAANEQLNKNSSCIVELSELLNDLPIHHYSVRKKNFRSPSGILKQMMTFKRSYLKGIKDVDVGLRFYEVALEFDNKEDELHAIANAIRRNRSFYSSVAFGNEIEGNCFPEGALLGHLHCFVEQRDSAELKPETRCRICKIKTEDIYHGNLNLMTMHLTIPITSINGKKKYGAEEFITVCPTCHAALHRTRPWVLKEGCENILG